MRSLFLQHFFPTEWQIAEKEERKLKVPTRRKKSFFLQEHYLLEFIRKNIEK